MPRFILIDRVPPISDFGALRLSHLAWRGLLSLGQVLPVVVGPPPPPRWRRALRRLGGRLIAARAGDPSGELDFGGDERQARRIGGTAARLPAADAVIFADAVLFRLFAGHDLGGARRVLLVDRWPETAADEAALRRAAAEADAIWALKGAIADRLAPPARRKKGAKAGAGRVAAIPAAIDMPPPSPYPVSGPVVLLLEADESEAGPAALAAAALDRLGSAGRVPALTLVQAGSVDAGFDLGLAIARIEAGAAVLAPGASPRFRPLLLTALAAGRPVIGTPAAFDGLAIADGREAVAAAAEPDEMAAALAALLADPAHAAALGAAARESVAAAHTGETMAAAVGAAAARLGIAPAPLDMTSLNLRPETRDLANYFNRASRLLSLSGFIRAGVPNHALSASFVADSVDELANAWVSVVPDTDDWAYFSADAVLPREVAPGQLKVRIEAFGLLLLELTVEAEPAPEVTGIIAIERTENAIAVDAWALDPDVKLQAGTRMLKLETVAPPAPVEAAAAEATAVDAEAADIAKPPPTEAVAAAPSAPEAARLRGTGRWPLDRKSVKTIPGFGRGQNFGTIDKWFGAETPSSAQLSRWKDRHAGKVAWLIGNGPSVRTEDLDRLDGVITFGFNRYYLSHDMTRLRPTYTVSGDRQMIDDFGQDIVDRSGGTVFLAHDAVPEVVGDYIWLRQVSVSPPLFSLNPDRAVTPGGSSLFVAMQVAHFMGIRRFYVYGADFRFVFKAHKASRDAYRAASGDDNHFIKNYRDGRAWCPPSFRQIASAFFAARTLMESEGGYIRNATRGGALEIFPRRDFDEALADP